MHLSGYHSVCGECLECLEECPPFPQHTHTPKSLDYFSGHRIQWNSILTHLELSFIILNSVVFQFYFIVISWFFFKNWPNVLELICLLLHQFVYFFINLEVGVVIAQWLQHQRCDQKVTSSSPRSGGIIFFSMVYFLCWLLFWYSSYPHVTAVAHKRSWSFCQKCRWQVTAKHTCSLMYVVFHGCMEYTECTKTATVSRGTSHVTTKQHCKYTTLVNI